MPLRVQRHKGTEFSHLETLNQFTIFLTFPNVLSLTIFPKSTLQHQILCAFVPLCLCAFVPLLYSSVLFVAHIVTLPQKQSLLF